MADLASVKLHPERVVPGTLKGWSRERGRTGEVNRAPFRLACPGLDRGTIRPVKGGARQGRNVIDIVDRPGDTQIPNGRPRSRELGV